MKTLHLLILLLYSFTSTTSSTIPNSSQSLQKSPFKTLLNPPSHIHFTPIRLKLGYTPDIITRHLLSHTIYNPPTSPTFTKGHGKSRIAICSTGQVRTFTEPRVYENIKKSFGDDTDHFMVLDPRVEYTWQNINVRKNFTHAELVEALSVVRPVKVVYYDGRAVERLMWRAIKRMTEWSGECFGKKGFHIQEWSKEVCFKMVEEFEIKRGCKYEFVVRMRPDVKVDVYRVVGGVLEGEATGTVGEAIWSNREYQNEEFVRTRILSASKVSAAISDQFSVIPRRFAGFFFGMFSRVLTRCPLKQDLAHRCPLEWRLNDELSCILGTSIISLPGFKGIVEHSDVKGFKVVHKIVRPFV